MDRAKEEDVTALRVRREALKGEFVGVGDFRVGSLVERYRRCGKANCHCAGPGARRHGPSWSLTREVSGKTVTRIIPAAEVEATRRQIKEYRRFKELTRGLVELNEQLCDSLLAEPEAASEEEAAKKGGSKRRSRPRSSEKSGPS